MKTAQEWLKELSTCPELPAVSIKDIVQIQFEAYQLGIEHSRDCNAVAKQCNSFVNQIIDNTIL